MKILLANVGNIRRNEIRTLAAALNENHTVTIVSMAAESSFKGQAFSYGGTPVRANPVAYVDVIKNTTADADPRGFDGINAYEFYATPADAVSVALCQVLAHERPDLCIAGIGNGTHFAQDIFCSSNIGMAMEAAFFGVPSICVAIPQCVGGHTAAECAPAVKFIMHNLEKFAAAKLPEHTFLNINIPAVSRYQDLKGVKITRLGWIGNIQPEFEEKTDSKGEKYFWAKNVLREGSGGEGTDIDAFNRGFVSVTPINCDATDYEQLEKYHETENSQHKKSNAAVNSFKKQEKGAVPQ